MPELTRMDILSSRSTLCLSDMLITPPSRNMVRSPGVGIYQCFGGCLKRTNRKSWRGRGDGLCKWMYAHRELFHGCFMAGQLQDRALARLEFPEALEQIRVYIRHGALRNLYSTRIWIRSAVGFNSHAFLRQATTLRVRARSNN